MSVFFGAALRAFALEWAYVVLVAFANKVLFIVI